MHCIYVRTPSWFVVIAGVDDNENQFKIIYIYSFQLLLNFSLKNLILGCYLIAANKWGGGRK